MVNSNHDLFKNPKANINLDSLLLIHIFVSGVMLFNSKVLDELCCGVLWVKLSTSEFVHPVVVRGVTGGVSGSEEGEVGVDG